MKFTLNSILKTYRFKLTVLYITILLVTLSVFAFLWYPSYTNFKKTKEFEKMESKDDILSSLQLYTKKNQSLDIFFTKNSSKEVHQAFIDDLHTYIVNQGLDLSIVKTSSVFTNQFQEYTSSTFYVEIEGGYKEMIELSKYVETNIEYIKIKSLEFYSVFNYQLKTKKLYCKYYVQRIQKK